MGMGEARPHCLSEIGRKIGGATGERSTDGQIQFWADDVLCNKERRQPVDLIATAVWLSRVLALAAPERRNQTVEPVKVVFPHRMVRREACHANHNRLTLLQRLKGFFCLVATL
jgi:hypothetical protein